MTIKTTTTEPAPVKEPKIKPSPKREPKEKPDENSPWTVPAPKVNPTPKANRMKMKKVVIDTRADLEAFSSLMTDETFFDKYTLSMELVSELGADKGMSSAEFTDRMMTVGEKALLSKEVINNSLLTTKLCKN